MNLNDLTTLSVVESTYKYDSVPILEDGEAPRWRFNYGNFKADPNPDILLLGAYRHPNTGNNLVGGINLHYLNRAQIDKLARILPEIMSANNLYQRYHTGKNLAPDIFDGFYRTYNAAHIHGVQKDIMYPKYGLLKTSTDWMKKKLGSLFKTKQQRKKDAEPKYPEDLKSMNTELDNVVQQLQQVQPTEPVAQTPEVKAAKKSQIAQRYSNTLPEIEKDEDEPLRRAYRDFERKQNPELKPTLPLSQIGPNIPTDQSEQISQQQSDVQATPQQQQAIKRKRFEQEEQENMEELMEPNPPTELETPEIITTDEQDLEESIIRYYSPRLKRYITESIQLIKV